MNIFLRSYTFHFVFSLLRDYRNLQFIFNKKCWIWENDIPNHAEKNYVCWNFVFLSPFPALNWVFNKCIPDFQQKLFNPRKKWYPSKKKLCWKFISVLIFKQCIKYRTNGYEFSTAMLDFHQKVFNYVEDSTLCVIFNK